MDVTVDCVIIVAAAGVTSWSFGSLKLSTIVRFTIVAAEFLPDELLISSLVPPGSSESYNKKKTDCYNLRHLTLCVNLI